MKGKATSFDIAYRAGVSQSTVSRALRNSPLVNEETRKKVQEIARELNYKVDKNASNLRTQKSGTLALLLFEDPTSDDSLVNPFFLAMLGSITRACALKGYDLLVSFQQFSEDWQADYTDTHKADGFILLGYGDFVDIEQKLRQLAEQQTHFVRWGAPIQGLQKHTLGCDNFQGGHQATQCMIDNGRREFAFVGGASEHCPEFYQRYLGHSNALKEAGLKLIKHRQVDAISTEESGYEATLKLLQQAPEIDAIVTASDLIAIGALRALHEQGRKVGEDVAVVGFDDIPAACFTNPPLTTIKQNTMLAGEMLVNNLLKLVAGEDVDDSLMPVELIVRETCGSQV